MKILSKYFKVVIVVAVSLVVVAASIFVGYLIGKNSNKPKAVMVSNINQKFDLKLPTETEKMVVTKEEVELKLVKIGELSTYSGEYTVTKSADFSRYVVDKIKIPGTTNKVELECKGIVKIGYDINKIVVKVDRDESAKTDSGKIYISLPEPTVNDNYIIWDDIKCSENNNIFNPIDFEQYRTLISEIEKDGLEKAKSEGVFEKADENIKAIITNFLSEFKNYEIVYM